MPATDKFFYDIKRLHVIFAFSAVAMTAMLLWLLAADNSDEWRQTQRTFANIEAARLRSEREAFQSTEQYEQATTVLTEERDEAKAELQAAGSVVDDLRAAERQAKHEVEMSKQALKNQNAVRDVSRANYDLDIRDNKPEEVLKQSWAVFEEEQRKADELNVQLQEAEKAHAEAVAALKAQTKQLDDLNAEYKKAMGEYDQLTGALQKVAPESTLAAVKRTIMQWPIIDGFNSPLSIRQDWLPDLHQTLGMTTTARFDRCRTCHLAIDLTKAGNKPSFPHGDVESKDYLDWVAEDKYPHPFATHPRLDLFLSATSPHPRASFGCTSCHDGQGSGTSFTNASHSPNDPLQEERWAEEYGYFHNHFWEYPMMPERFQESTCLKCHHSVVELGVNAKFGSSAPKVVEGYNLVKTFGCFGCHEIHGYDGGLSIGPDLRLEPQTAEDQAKYDADPNLFAGAMRKVGPSLKHVAEKTTAGWIYHWTEEPKRFRPTTRMPQFFDLTNQQDPHAAEFMPVELAGITKFLVDNSQSIELLQPEGGYKPDAARGESLFSERGCLACHSHEKFPKNTAVFGPELSNVHAKIRPGKEGFNWLYTWLRDPERHHPKTKMPNLFLEVEGTGEKRVDPAADIAAFLLQGGPGDYPLPEVSDEGLDQLVTLMLSNVLTKEQVKQTMANREYPVPAKLIKGDEIELAADGSVDEAGWREMKLRYIGRKTISRYGCYGCHEIKGFEKSRPIGTTLQDWGRKDTSKLAVEHIEEYLHHHGEPNGSSTVQYVEEGLQEVANGDIPPGPEREEVLRKAYFYESLIHHGRPGFIWQKLRSPRSYDYKKIETKRYDERLRMPKFPFNDDQIEAISTFVLGLVAEPPDEKYVYQPQGPALARVQGEQLIQKYNCTGCHMLQMPEITYRTALDDVSESRLTPDDYPEAVQYLNQLKPARDGLVSHNEETDEAIVNFRGLVASLPDPEEDLEYQEYTFDLWENLKVGDKELYPATRMLVPAQSIVEWKPGYGGTFTDWLVERLVETKMNGNRAMARQAAPPTLYEEGHKVQTRWLHDFLLEPMQIRHTTVLRMPRFNMTSEEAQILADYFAAVDGASYPYQTIPQRSPEYLAQKNAELVAKGEKPEYLEDCWKVLNAPLCIKCHSLGGRQVQISDPKTDIRAPNLEMASNRLRPEWLSLWLYKPQWITPYTSMPAPLPRTKVNFPELFHGDGNTQTIALRDALLNYYRLMERQGKLVYEPKVETAPETGGEE